MSAPAGLSPSRCGRSRTAAEPGVVRLALLHDYLVPLDDGAVARYFRETLFAAHTGAERGLALLKDPGSRLFWRLASDIRRLPIAAAGAPSGHLTASSGRARAGGPDGDWQDGLAMIADALGPASAFGDPGSRAQPRVRWLARCQRIGGERRSIVFLFEPAADTPYAVVKLRTGGSGLSREWRALQRCGELPPEVAETVPRPFAFREIGGGEALWLSWRAGRSAYVDLHQDVRPSRLAGRHFEAAAAWLARFHRATAKPGRGFGREELEAVVGAMQPAVRSAVSRSRWYRDLRSLLSKQVVPLAWSHGDFWPRNLLFESRAGRGAGEGERVAVVDWEAFQEEMPVFSDLLWFPVAYGQAYPWSRYRRAPAADAFRLTFIDDTAISREVRRYLRSYCHWVGLDLEAVGLLLPLFLLLRAGRRQPVERRSSDADLEEPWRTFYSMIVDAGRCAFSA